MKKVIYILSAVGLLTLGACNDQLETNPTDKVSGTIIFSDANGAETAMNGIYRATYVAGWGTGWADENPGFVGVYLAGDLMGEDKDKAGFMKITVLMFVRIIHISKDVHISSGIFIIR